MKKLHEMITYELIKTKKRLTFDILWQHPDTRYRGDDDGDYFTFTASNGYQVISRSRMDIQTERLWLLGASDDERSGTMVFSSDEKRDAAYDQFVKAIDEWNQHWMKIPSQKHVADDLFIRCEKCSHMNPVAM